MGTTGTTANSIKSLMRSEEQEGNAMLLVELGWKSVETRSPAQSNV